MLAAFFAFLASSRVLILLQILFPPLVFLAVVVTAYVLSLFGLIPALGGWLVTTAGVILSVLFYLYTGKRTPEPEQLRTVRELFVSRVLRRTATLLPTCAALICILAVALTCGIRSQTLVFVPSPSVEAQVYVVEGERQYHLGVATAEAPLTRRLLSGLKRLRVTAAGYSAKDMEVDVGFGLLSDQTRTIRLALISDVVIVSTPLGGDATKSVVERVPESSNTGSLPTSSVSATGPPASGLPGVTLVAPDIIVQDMSGRIDDTLQIPRDVQALPATTLAFTLSSPSPTPLMLPKLYVRVTRVEQRRESTFPYYGEGAPPPQLMKGFVRIRAEPGLYPVALAGAPMSVGRGLQSATFFVRVFCDYGFRYYAHLVIGWVDEANPSRTGVYALPHEIELDVPKLIEWESLVAGSGRLKILYYRFADNLTRDLSRLDRPPPQYSILVADPGYDRITKLPKVPHGSESQFSKVVGSIRGYNKRPRSFILIDSRTLLLQDDDRLNRADIIEDPVRIAEIEGVYDPFVQ